MSVKVYLDYMSQPSRAVLAYLKAAKIPHEVVEIRVVTGDNRKPEFKKKNPLAKIPVIDDEGFLLPESHAIMTYLSSKYVKNDPLYPSDLKTRARIDSYLHWHHIGTRRSSAYFRASMSHMFPNDPPMNKETEYKLVKRTLELLDETFLQDSKYLCGQDKITIADYSCVSELMQLYMTDFDFTKFPKIVEYMGRCLQDPGLKEAHVIFHKVLEKMRAKPKPKL